MTASYAEFVAGKAVTSTRRPIHRALPISGQLFPFQRAIVEWALAQGRAAIFAECGLGKTPMQLEWARHVPGEVLILTPLAVAHQTVREAAKFHIDAAYAAHPDDHLTHHGDQLRAAGPFRRESIQRGCAR